MMRLQLKYNMQTARKAQTLAGRLEEISRIAAM